jgi:transposase
MAMITILATNSEFRHLHKKNITRETNPLNKMQSIIALCGKLIRVFYALLRTGRDYRAEKMLGDIEQGMKAAT